MIEVQITPDAASQIEELPYDIQVRVAGIVGRLGAWPDVSGAKPLRGALKGQFRIRTGDYRVQFSVERSGRSLMVVIRNVGHRDGFYDE